MASLQQILKQKGFLPNGDYGFIIIQENCGWACRICSIRINDSTKDDTKGTQVSIHVNGKKHRHKLTASVVPGIDEKKISSISQNTFIQTKLDSMKEGLIGLEYLLEIVDLNYATKERNYYCVLCGNKGNDNILLSHMILDSHRAKYLKKHFPTVYGVLKPFFIKENRFSNEVKNVLNEIANAIQKTFGRLKPSLVEAGEFYPDQISFFTIIEKAKHINETSNKTFTDLVPKDLLAKLPKESLDTSSKRKQNRSISKSELISEHQTQVSNERAKQTETVYSNEDGTYLMEQEWFKYSDTPEDHPHYKEEWRKFWKKKYTELKAEGKDPSKYDFKPEWKEYWERRIIELQPESSKIVGEGRPVSGWRQDSRIRIDRARGRSRSPRSGTRRSSPQRKVPSTFGSRSPVPRPSRLRDCPSDSREISSHRRDSPSRRRDSPSRRIDSPSRRKDSPSRRKDCPSDSRDISSHRRDSPSRLRDCPSDSRDISSHRRDSPSRHRDSPPRRIDSPSRRRDSSSRFKDCPSDSRDICSHRRDSPSRRKDCPPDSRDILSRRRDSPSRRRDSPSDRRDIPPHRRDSPSRRKDCPSDFRDIPSLRRDLPSRRRGSPSDHRDIPSHRRDSPSDYRDIPSQRRDSQSNNPRDEGAPLGVSYSRSVSRDLPAHSKDSLLQTGDYSSSFENSSPRKESLVRHIDKPHPYSRVVTYSDEDSSHRTLQINLCSSQRDGPFQKPPERNESFRGHYQETAPFRYPNFDSDQSALSCRKTSGSTGWGDISVENRPEMRKPDSHFRKSSINQNEAPLNVNILDPNIKNSSFNPHYPEIPPLMSVMTTNTSSTVKNQPLSGERELKRIKVSNNKFRPVHGVSERSQDSSRKRRSPARVQDAEVNLMPVLRLLTALEERLGSLGPQIVNLFSKVLDMENKNAGSSEKLLDDKNSLLLITAKEKLKGQIIARIVPPTEVNALNTVIANIEQLVERFNRKNERQERVPGVGAVDSEKLSQDIVNTLLTQGNNDINRHELTQFVENLVSKEIPQTELNYTHGNQLSSLSGQQNDVSINQNNLETIARAISKKFFEKGASRGHIASLVTSVVNNVKKRSGSSQSQSDFSNNHTFNEYSLGNSSVSRRDTQSSFKAADTGNSFKQYGNLGQDISSNTNPSESNAWRYDTSSGFSTGQPLNAPFGAGRRLQFTFSNFGEDNAHQGIRRFPASNKNPYN